MRRAGSPSNTEEDPTKRIKAEPENASESKTEINGRQLGLQNGYELVWNQLQFIVNNIVCDEHDNVNQKEMNDLLLVASQDPDKLTFLDSDYGSIKIETAIKAASKLLYSNGSIDMNLSEYLWWKRNELIDGLNISYWNEHLNGCNSMAICKIAGMLFNDYAFDVPMFNRNSLEIKGQRLKFNLLMTVDPNLVREKKTVLDIAKSKVEIGISLCTHILEGMSKQHSNLLPSFLEKRNKKIHKFWRRYLKKATANHYTIFKQVRSLVKKHWTYESNDQIEAFTILLIMEPKILFAKFFFFTHAINLSNESLSDIEKTLKHLLHPSDDEKTDTKLYPSVDSATEVSMPIVVSLKQQAKIKRFQRNLNRHLRRRLFIPHDSQISILLIKNKCIVCANESTLKLLTNAINEFQYAEIAKSEHLAPQEFRKVNMLASARLKETFSVYMKEIKKIYPHLRTELWKLCSSYDFNLNVEIDIYSIAHLELLKRRIIVDEKVFKFNIRYFN